MNQIIQDISDFIFVEHEPQKADAIMVVGGVFPEVGEMAADLWKKGYAPVVFASGGVSIKIGKFAGVRSKQEIYNKEYTSEFDFYQDVLRMNGVSEDAILGEQRSSFTRENAMFAREVADEHGMVLKKVILVCKAFHARRSLMFYQAAFPEVDFFVVTFAAYGITKETWYQSEYGVERVLGEMKRCGEQFTNNDIEKYKYSHNLEGKNGI